MKKKISGKFTVNPLNPRDTFLALTARTYPHGHEEEVLNFLPELNEDEFGNYYKIIGDKPTTMFTSHLDTADHRQNETERYSIIEDGVENITTGGETILGADDKAGVTVMLYMMAKNVPGLYYFFIGEERGGIGSKRLANGYEKVDYVKDIVRCVSFDRRGTGSVITRQLGRECCSETFAKALSDQYNGLGMQMTTDPTGIFTDSAMLMGVIPECTNISVGYMNEHTGREVQNITHLEKLCVASCKVDWDSLPTERSLDEAKNDANSDYPKEYQSIVKSANKLDSFGGIGEEQFGWVLYFDIEGLKPSVAASELNGISQLIDKHGLDRRCFTDNGYLIITL